MDNQFRHLLKFKGRYRVLTWLTTDTFDFPRDEKGKIQDDYDGLYIPCKSKSWLTHSYDYGYLVWYCPSLGVGRKVKKALEAKRNPIEFKYEETDEEVIITFREYDLDEMAKLIKPKTAGANIDPYSSKNLPRAEYKIPEEDSDKLTALIEDLDKVDKMHIVKSCVKDFDNVIQKKKGKKFNLEDDRENSGLKPKVYIHYIGMWDEFLEYVGKEVKKLKKTKKKSA